MLINIQGYCPACGEQTLRAESGAGLVFCVSPGCPNTSAAAQVLLTEPDLVGSGGPSALTRAMQGLPGQSDGESAPWSDANPATVIEDISAAMEPVPLGTFKPYTGGQPCHLVGKARLCSNADSPDGSCVGGELCHHDMRPCRG